MEGFGGVWVVAVGCWGECVGYETDLGFRGIVVAGCMVWWICLDGFWCAEEFTEESLAEFSEAQRIETFSGRIFRIILLFCRLQHKGVRKQSTFG